jgi:hypothetical protein
VRRRHGWRARATRVNTVRPISDFLVLGAQRRGELSPDRVNIAVPSCSRRPWLSGGLMLQFIYTCSDNWRVAPAALPVLQVIHRKARGGSSTQAAKRYAGRVTLALPGAAKCSREAERCPRPRHPAAGARNAARRTRAPLGRAAIVWLASRAGRPSRMTAAGASRCCSGSCAPHHHPCPSSLEWIARSATDRQSSHLAQFAPFTASPHRSPASRRRRRHAPGAVAHCNSVRLKNAASANPEAVQQNAAGAVRRREHARVGAATHRPRQEGPLQEGPLQECSLQQGPAARGPAAAAGVYGADFLTMSKHVRTTLDR